MTVLEVKNLNLGFWSEDKFLQALYDVSYKLEEGKTLALVGESGCGKTMSAMCILNLLPKNAEITSGEVLYNGENLLKFSEKDIQTYRGKRISYIPQDPMTSLNPLYTIGDQMLEVLKIHRNMQGDEALKEVINALDTVQIPDAKSRLKDYPHEFSGGMKQRVIIAMALVCNAKIIIADEPTTALDVTIQKQIMKLLNEIKENNGTSILLITHDLALVSEYSDNISVMYAGRIVEQAPSDSFFSNPNHPYSRALLKSLPSNKITRLQTIKGQPPVLSDKINGCRFNPRCDYCTERCTINVPQLIEISSGHYSACYLNTV